MEPNGSPFKKRERPLTRGGENVRKMDRIVFALLFLNESIRSKNGSCFYFAPQTIFGWEGFS
jgi:hypothetical protein